LETRGANRIKKRVVVRELDQKRVSSKVLRKARTEDHKLSGRFGEGQVGGRV